MHPQLYSLPSPQPSKSQQSFPIALAEKSGEGSDWSKEGHVFTLAPTDVAREKDNYVLTLVAGWDQGIAMQLTWNEFPTGKRSSITKDGAKTTDFPQNA